MVRINCSQAGGAVFINREIAAHVSDDTWISKIAPSFFAGTGSVFQFIAHHPLYAELIGKHAKV